VGRGQTALLHLGEAHSRLGHSSHALHALNETVRCAQQSSDDTCLAHALASLCRLLLHSTTAAAEGAGGWCGGSTGAAAALHRHRQVRTRPAG
jgi:ATP/maltotriose-dependent transcriptional regulator MalT